MAAKPDPAKTEKQLLLHLIRVGTLRFAHPTLGQQGIAEEAHVIAKE